MAKWVTGQWQETNVSLHHTGHPHKLSSTPGPRSEFLIRLWWGWRGLCFERGNQGCHKVYPPFTKSSVPCVFHFLHCSRTEWTVFGFQQHWSASELLGLGILQGKWSANLEKWLTAGRLWLTSLGEDTSLDLLRGLCWYTSLWWRIAGMRVCL